MVSVGTVKILRNRTTQSLSSGQYLAGYLAEADANRTRFLAPLLCVRWSITSSPAPAGLGLTIARQLAQRNDAELVLANHPAGGLEACLIWRRGLVPSASSAEAAYLTPA
jgi:hypothetical protein